MLFVLRKMNSKLHMPIYMGIFEKKVLTLKFLNICELVEILSLIVTLPMISNLRQNFSKS